MFFSASATISLWISFLVPTSIPCVGSFQDQQLRVEGQTSAQHHFLLVAAAQAGNRMKDAAGFDLEVFHLSVNQLHFLAFLDHAQFIGNLAQFARAEVIQDGADQEQAVMPPVFRNVNDTLLYGFLAAARLDRLAFIFDSTFVEGNSP